MSKLESAEEVAGEWLDGHQRRMWGSDPASLTKLIETDREATEQAVWERVKEVIEPVLWNGIKERIKQACLAAGKNDATRERLGRALWSYEACDYEWKEVAQHEREIFCDKAAVVLAEQRKIEEEASNG